MYAFYKKYFLINLADYPNIGIDFPITIVLLCFFAALIVTTIVVNLRRSKIETIIKQLSRYSAYSESDAKTLSELKLDNKAFRYLLSKPEGQIASMISRVGEKKPTYEEYMSKDYKTEKIDFEEARFYIKEEARDRAKKVLELGSATPLNTILFCLLLLAVYICLALLMPGILSAINGYLGSFN